MIATALYACAQGAELGTFYPGADASVGGEAGTSGQGGDAGQGSGGTSGAGEAGTGGSAPEGGSAGTAGTSAAGTGGGGTGGAAGGQAGSAGSCTPPVAGGECDTFPPCGCKAGDSCDVVSTSGTTKCGPSGNIKKGFVCKYINDCAPGLTCVGSACKPFCEVPGDCTTSGADCTAVTFSQPDGGTADVPGMRTCTDQCDLITAQSCGPGAGCYPVDDIKVQPGHSVCVEAGTSTTSCSPTIDCAPGYVCLSDNKCYKWCRSNVASDCSGTCYQFQDNNNNVGFYYVGAQGYGVCD
jgi:hypothetical protein